MMNLPEKKMEVVRGYLDIIEQRARLKAMAEFLKDDDAFKKSVKAQDEAFLNMLLDYETRIFLVRGFAIDEQMAVINAGKLHWKVYLQDAREQERRRMGFWRRLRYEIGYANEVFQEVLREAIRDVLDL